MIYLVEAALRGDPTCNCPRWYFIPEHRFELRTMKSSKHLVGCPMFVEKKR